MARGTKIEWCDDTVNAIAGCTKQSEACDHCYAINPVRRMANMPQHAQRYSGLVKNGDWTGKVVFLPDQLEKPKRWRKPRNIFMNSISDWFHACVPDEWRDAAWDTMKQCSRHMFFILTKRAGAMKQYIKRRGEVLPNLWLGVTAETQARADRRVPILASTPAAGRFVSVEPMLESVDLRKYLYQEVDDVCGQCLDNPNGEPCLGFERMIDWVIVGGESGHHARPMHTSWVRSLRDTCLGTSDFIEVLHEGRVVNRYRREQYEVAYEQRNPEIEEAIIRPGYTLRQVGGVAFFLKQWGAWFPDGILEDGGERFVKRKSEPILDGQRWQQFPEFGEQEQHDAS